MSLHLIMLVRFLPQLLSNTVEALMCLQDWLWTNMEGNEINTFT